MARVTVFEGGNIDAPQTTGARFQAQDYGPGVGEGVQRLGEAGSEVANVIDKIGQLHDEASVKEAANSVSEWYTGAGYTGPDAFYNKKGKDALLGQGAITKGLDTMLADTRKGLQNERQRSLFDDAMNPQQLEWHKQISVHALNETSTYATNEATARAGMSAELAGHTYMDNPTEGEKHLETMRAEIAAAGKLQGWGADQISEKQFKATSSIYHDIGVQLASSGPQGPDLADKFIELHKDSMTLDDSTSLAVNSRARRDAMEAEQRRLEAEQRRAENEAKRDARDRVESGLVRISSGLPLSPDEYTSIHQDAATTGDPNLLKRVEEGQFVNNLSIQHRNDTPVELQDRVNQLSAAITKAGAKADPQQILERDHLQQMFNQGSSELNSNPLAWATKHLGIQVQPLNIADPNSIQNRVDVANAVAKKTGHAPQPLQPSEIATLAPQWTRGSIEQKQALVSQIAKFGPLADAAAQQIAPNDNGLHNLIGLATHQNQGVGASRVNQILTGYEAIKSMPKLVNKDQSIQQFNGYLGNALQFLPGVKEGVYTNAKALLAAEANEAGVQEWDSLDGRAWFKAVNSSLGAYTKGGEQYGGIAVVNGVPTVLPENMTQSDFESRISRSTGPQFRAAANGAPVYGNGESPTASEIKKMQWVPSGDGTYRLSDGHAFLHNQHGDFYEIDARKLPGNLDAQLASHGYVRR